MIVETILNPMRRRPQNDNVTPTDGNLATLRERLMAFDVWPEAGDEFLALLPVSRWQAPPLTEEDKEWAIIVVRDTLRGLDIGSNYPAFFQKLITNPKLRQAFLDELDRQAISSQNGTHLL
ncbi:MAG: hypothetical protein CSA11_02390 [Chloroflexi bacterium]|nr:MAG: hypothetical protein CSA11_02390 [Chloroflexota bacterium]